AFRMSPVFLNKLIRKRGQGFDAVLLDHSIMGAYAPLVRKLFPDACLAWNVHELSSFSRRRKEKLAAYNPVRRLAFLFERIRSQIAEKMIYSSCDLVLTFSSAEYGSIRSAGCPADKVQFVQPHVDGHAGTDGARPSSSSGGVLFFGKMDRENNRDAAEILIKEVFPRIKQKVPGARCYILGAEPPERLTRLASVDVEISGYVEDFKRYLTSIKVAVFPLRMGSGIKFKILDALSWGIPVITTGVGVEGIEGISPALRIADRPEEMAEQAVQVLSMDRERYEPLSGEARDFISRNYDWQGNCEAIENMINWCQNKKRGRKTGRERAVRTIQ
ncbi:MAG TPA: glycosyltransferase, partial [Candidatus Omnitrophota bacterium]|nr:glycosyltransferase [Candidatus Omnitrophota bacterium]